MIQKIARDGIFYLLFFHSEILQNPSKYIYPKNILILFILGRSGMHYQICSQFNFNQIKRNSHEKLPDFIHFLSLH